jgi:hypothetical protein
LNNVAKHSKATRVDVLVGNQPVRDVSAISTIYADSIRLAFHLVFTWDEVFKSAMKTQISAATAALCLIAGSLVSWAQEKVNPMYAPAQAILDQTIKDHPEILVIAMHVTPPGGKDNVIIASRFNVSPGKWEIQRIGKVADEDDMRVVKTGKPNLEVNTTGDRFEVEAPMLDGAGKIVGAVGIVLPYRKGEDQKALQKKAETIRDEIRKRTPTVSALFAQGR